MKAIIQPGYGSPDILELQDIDKPTPADDAVLVRVRAASVNALDWRGVRASPFIVRLMGGVRRPKVPSLGVDAAGVVEAMGKDVTDLKPGDEVFGMRTGAFAEYVSGRTFVRKPANVTYEQAAAVPAAGSTALQAVRDKAKVQPGQRVLVTGAGGGVGHFAVQIAKAFGGEVTAVTNTGNLEMVRSIGADHVVDYTRDDFTRGEERYDVILDVAGTPSLRACRRALAPGGTLVLVGAGKGPGGPLTRLFMGLVRSRVLRQRVIGFISSASKDDLLELRDLIEAGKVTPVIDRTYPLSKTADAVRYVETGHARGKVVITV